MKMENKKKINWFKYIMISLFVVYSALYLLNLSGYYDGSIRRKVEFTTEQIEQFEADVKDGKNVDLTNYLENQTKDYTNAVSKLGYTISSNVDKFLNEGISEIIKVLSSILS